MEEQHERYMLRCLQLAKLGNGNTALNPMVGAVLVHKNRIIGEGYHKEYGGSHAEVNCINSVLQQDKQLIDESTLYVLLEPCAHFGKTPPCSDLIIRSRIPKVVIGCGDPFEKVDGKGIEKLESAGVEVIVGILEHACIKLNKRFFIFHQKQRPYIILKWAQTANKKIASTNDKRLLISDEITNRIVHKWRFEEAGILIGTNTAILDNPSLTNRLWSGKNPVRIIIDLASKAPLSLKIFDFNAPTIVFVNSINNEIDEHKSNLERKYNFPIINIMLSKESSLNYRQLNNQAYHYEVDDTKPLPLSIADACYKLNIQSILIEGGAKLLQSFINENLYDEIRIVTNKTLFVDKGLDSPEFSGCIQTQKFDLLNDEIEVFENLSIINKTN